MKTIYLIAVFITASCFSFGHTIPVNTSNNFPILANSDIFSVHIPDPRQMLSEIMTVVGLQPNFELKEAKVDNIEASISHRKRYILYNPEFITWINNSTKDKWATITLLAHEVGHHLNGHTLRKGGSTPVLELEADEFSGFVLYKLGASLEQAQAVMTYIAEIKPSRTHPARDSRLAAIENGWRKASSSEGISVTAKK
ncbi:MAG: hypothetical protein ACXWWC_11750 [Chitinophagaceae bacterium]